MPAHDFLALDQRETRRAQATRACAPLAYWRRLCLTACGSFQLPQTAQASDLGTHADLSLDTAQVYPPEEHMQEPAGCGRHALRVPSGRDSYGPHLGPHPGNRAGDAGAAPERIARQWPAFSKRAPRRRESQERSAQANRTGTRGRLMHGAQPPDPEWG